MRINLSKIFTIFFLALCIFNLLFFAFAIHSVVTSEEYYPNDGVWYCEELQMQLAFDGTMDSCVVVEGEIIPCTWIVEHGSSFIDVCKQKRNSYYPYPGETIFGGKYIGGNLDGFVLTSDDENRAYIFRAISDDTRIDVIKSWEQKGQ